MEIDWYAAKRISNESEENFLYTRHRLLCETSHFKIRIHSWMHFKNKKKNKKRKIYIRRKIKVLSLDVLSETYKLININRCAFFLKRNKL